MATVIEGIKFYTIPETAKALNVTPQTVRAYIKQGKLKGQRIGRPILITENNLKEFLQEGKLMRVATLKYCPKCKTEKPLELFNKHAKERDGLQRLCRDCQKESNRKYLSTEKGATTTRQAHLRRKYGIDLQTYEELLLSQGNKCKICGVGSNPDSRANYFVIDHNHSTGDIRGLLCTKCNALLGLALDSEDILERAKQYLKNSRVKYSTAIKITLQK